MVSPLRLGDRKTIASVRFVSRGDALNVTRDSRSSPRHMPQRLAVERMIKKGDKGKTRLNIRPQRPSREQKGNSLIPKHRKACEEMSEVSKQVSHASPTATRKAKPYAAVEVQEINKFLTQHQSNIH